jgi:Fe-S-cluster containining protein
MTAVQQFASQAVRRTLGQATDVDACVELTGQIDRLLDQAAAHLQGSGARLACRTGCNFCCHLRVNVLPHEAIALFRHLQSQMPTTLAHEVRTALLRKVRPAPGASRACAFLVAGECAAYEVRPSACAAYHSTSKERCEQSFRDPAIPSGTVALRALQAVALELETGVNDAVKAEGLSNVALELHTAVAALLADPALIARWRAGRPLIKEHR